MWRVLSNRAVARTMVRRALLFRSNAISALAAESTINGVKLRAMTEVDAIATDAAEAMVELVALQERAVERAANAGLRSLFVGFETLNPDNLREQGKLQNLHRDYDSAIRRLHEHGVMVNGSSCNPKCD